MLYKHFISILSIFIFEFSIASKFACSIFADNNKHIYILFKVFQLQTNCE